MYFTCLFDRYLLTKLTKSRKKQQTNSFYKKRVDGEKEKQSNSARLQGKAKSLVKRSAPIAQLVEQRIENPRVPGSNPGRGTIFRDGAQ